MITKRCLIGELVYLRQIELDDCTPTYVGWLNDPDVNKYLETRWTAQNLEMILDFVRSQRENDHSILFAIITKLDDRHIGNIKIGPINAHYKHADISYFIGDKKMWHKGIITEVINLVLKFAFEELKLHKVEAGAYADAVGSWKALEKNGFTREAVFREHVVCKGKRMDVYRYSILAREYGR